MGWDVGDEGKGVGWEAGAARKYSKYMKFIDDACDFLPLSAETFGGWSPDAREFLRELSVKVAHVTAEEPRLVLANLSESLSTCIFRNVARMIRARTLSTCADSDLAPRQQFRLDAEGPPHA